MFLNHISVTALLLLFLKETNHDGTFLGLRPAEIQPSGETKCQVSVMALRQTLQLSGGWKRRPQHTVCWGEYTTITAP